MPLVTRKVLIDGNRLLSIRTTFDGEEVVQTISMLDQLNTFSPHTRLPGCG